MADALEDVVYPDGHAIMQQGEGDYFGEPPRVSKPRHASTACDRPQTSSARSLW